MFGYNKRRQNSNNDDDDDKNIQIEPNIWMQLFPIFMDAAIIQIGDQILCANGKNFGAAREKVAIDEWEMSQMQMYLNDC